MLTISLKYFEHHSRNRDYLNENHSNTPTGTCEDDETDCGDHSVCSNKNDDDGYECSCADGFSGDPVMNEPAVCLPDPCDTFFTVPHGSHDCLNLPSGEECSVSCDEGYTVSGGNVTCYAGSFTNIPTCEPNPCTGTPSIFGADPSAMSCGDSTCLSLEDFSLPI